jgi:flagellar hook-basal body complex protein FliE
MTQSVNLAIQALAGGLTPDASTSRPEAAAPGFGDALDKLVGAVKTSGSDSNQAVASMVAGEGEVHDAMIALQRADLTFQFAMQVRNKLVQAYQEVMRMPV